MDVKTLLLLGTGMVVLSLVGFCSVQSRSASLSVAKMPAAALEMSLLGPPHAHGRVARAHTADGHGYIKTVMVSAAPAGANR